MAALYQRDFHIKCESRAVRQDMAPSPTEAKGEGSPQAANSASSEAEAEGEAVAQPAGIASEHMRDSVTRSVGSGESLPPQARVSIPGAYRVMPSSAGSLSNISTIQTETDETAPSTVDVENGVPPEPSENQNNAEGGDDLQITAYLVEDMDDVPSAEVEEIKPFHQRKEGRITMSVVGVLLAALVVLLGVFLTQSQEEAPIVSEMPSVMPSQAPTFDSRPTLQVVQSRNVLNCGVEEAVEGDEGAVKFGQFTSDMCRALAASVFGDPAKTNLISVGVDRYEKLMGRELDILVAGDTFTLEKVIKEPTTGSPLAFGYPYYTAAVVYVGPTTYVQCANGQKRYDECNDLSICAVDTPEIRSLITSYFPASFITFGPFSAMEESLKSGSCNVIVSDTYRLSGSTLLRDSITEEKYIISDYHISRNLLASVVRFGDSEWYDIVEGTRLASFRALQVGIYQNSLICPAESSVNTTVDLVSLYNAPTCVGNMIEIFQESLGQTVLSIGSFLPVIDAPNFGSLECDDCKNVLEDGKLKDIKETGQLECAVYLDPVHNLTRSSLATLVNEKFCELLAVAIFQGKPDAVNITYIDEMDYSAYPREYDIVAGASWEQRVGWDLTNAGSHSNALPYFVHDKYRNNGTVYDGVGNAISYEMENDDASIIWLANAVVTATIYAQRQGITKANHFDMPLIHLLGEGLTFMLRDVIAYSGNYDDIINEAFVNSDGATDIGWNIVIQNYDVAAKTPVTYCDYTGKCPPCTWTEVDGIPICFSFGPY